MYAPTRNTSAGKQMWIHRPPGNGFASSPLVRAQRRQSRSARQSGQCRRHRSHDVDSPTIHCSRSTPQLAIRPTPKRTGRIRAHMSACIRNYSFIHVNTQTHIHIYVRKHTRTHAHTSTQTSHPQDTNKYHKKQIKYMQLPYTNTNTGKNRKSNQKKHEATHVHNTNKIRQHQQQQTHQYTKSRCTHNTEIQDSMLMGLLSNHKT